MREYILTVPDDGDEPTLQQTDRTGLFDMLVELATFVPTTYDLDENVLKVLQNAPYGSENVDEAGLFSETFLYALYGKEDGRSAKARFYEIVRTLGFDRIQFRKAVEAVYRERDEEAARREAKTKLREAEKTLLRLLAGKDKGLAECFMTDVYFPLREKAGLKRQILVDRQDVTRDSLLWELYEDGFLCLLPGYSPRSIFVIDANDTEQIERVRSFQTSDIDEWRRYEQEHNPDLLWPDLSEEG